MVCVIKRRFCKVIKGASLSRMRSHKTGETTNFTELNESMHHTTQSNATEVRYTRMLCA